MRDLCEHVTSLLEKLTEFPEKEGEALIKATLGVGVSLEDEYGHVGQKAIETAYNDIMTRLCFCLGNLRVILLYMVGLQRDRRASAFQSSGLLINTE